MKNIALLFIASLLMIHSFALFAQQEALIVNDLRVEYLENPVGIDEMQPRFFWKLSADQPNTRQTDYQIRVGLSTQLDDPAILVFDTGKRQSSQSIQIPYDGPELQSATRYYWQVRAWDNHGKVSPWSETAYWEMGLLSHDEWVADWVEAPWEEDPDKMLPATMLRKEFSLSRTIVHARAYVSSYGLYEMHINGQRLGSDFFTPGWTSYNKRVQYQTYDVTDLLSTGENAVGIILGDGWYKGFLGYTNQRNTYGEKTAAIAQIVVKYDDGSTDVITTNESWHASTGPIIYSDIYNGEHYDARLEKPGWNEPGFNDSSWSRVAIANHGKNHLIAPQGPPVRKIQELKPLAIFVTPQGDTVVDMGQNMVGWVRLQVEGPRGTKVVLTHGEVLDKEGNFYRVNIRSAQQRNTYILKGDGKETWEPHFTFQGFRYVVVKGYPGELTKDALTGVVIHSEMEPTGHFDCSHPLVNRLQHNIVWGQKGNFLDVPTDCPQRDERLGWTGDAQVFVRTANTNMNAAAFFTKWLGDLATDQLENGSIPHVIPHVLAPRAAGAAGWADAGTIVPWAMYQHFDDKRILERQYSSMKAWVEYIQSRARNEGDPLIWSGDFHFGDWLSFNTTGSAYPGAYTERDMIATAYFARSTDLLARSAKIIGKETEAARYKQLFENIKKAFQDEFVTPNGRVISDTQTSYLLALRYNLLPEELRPMAAQKLLLNIQGFNHHTTGFLGTPHLNHVLSEFGYNDQAYSLLLREAYPSWLYPVTKDATTIWERWDGIKPDGSFQDPGMNSFNHYAYGAIGEWLFKEVAGIKSMGPGYQSILIEPSPGGGLKHARAIQESLYGTISSSWKFDEGDFVLAIEIPANSHAEVMLPFAMGKEVVVDGKDITNNADIQGYHAVAEKISVKVGSGQYEFRYNASAFPESATPQPDEGTPDAVLDTNSRLAELLAKPQTREVLFEEMPSLMNSLWLSQYMGYTLNHVLEILPVHLQTDSVNPTLLQQKLLQNKQ